MGTWSLGRAFSILTKQYIGLLNQRMKHTPIERYYYPLYIIGKSNGQLNQQELANHLLIDKVVLVRILDSLCQDGYIERVIDPNDRRKHLLKITQKAQPWIAEIEKGITEVNQFFYQFLPEEQRYNFAESLKTLTQSALEIDTEKINLIIQHPENS